METIDVRLQKVLKKELTKTPQIKKDSFEKINIYNPLFESIQTEYTIIPKDTIGKNILFNTTRK